MIDPGMDVHALRLALERAREDRDILLSVCIEAAEAVKTASRATSGPLALALNDLSTVIRKAIANARRP